MTNTLDLLKGYMNKHRLTFHEENHKYMGDNREVKGSVSSVIEPLSPYSTMNVDEGVLEAAGVRGTMVHKGIEDHFKGVPITQRKMIQPYQTYIDAFTKGESEYKDRFDILHSELQLYSVKHKYAGTIDALVYNHMTKRFGLLDFKTNSVRIDELVSAQLAGYMKLVNEGVGSEIKIEDAYVLYLGKNGEYHFKAIDTYSGMRAFDECLSKG